MSDATAPANQSVNQPVEDSIFTKIIKGEIPCHKLYEDEKTFAFMDIHPIQPGQCIVVSKQQVDYTWDLDDADYLAVMATSKKIALALRRCFPGKLVAVHIEGLDVKHPHIKIFPFTNHQEFHHAPDASKEPDHEALAAFAAKIAAALN